MTGQEEPAASQARIPKNKKGEPMFAFFAASDR